jgi:hypothetical protein
MNADFGCRVSKNGRDGVVVSIEFSKYGEA